MSECACVCVCEKTGRDKREGRVRIHEQTTEKGEKEDQKKREENGKSAYMAGSALRAS